MWTGYFLDGALHFRQIMTKGRDYALRRGIGGREQSKWMITTHFKAPRTETAVVEETVAACPG